MIHENVSMMTNFSFLGELSLEVDIILFLIFDYNNKKILFALVILKDHKCYSMFDLNSRPD